MTKKDYVSHYKKYLHIYEELSMVNGGKTIWIPTDGHNAWYKSTKIDKVESEEAWEKGFPYKSTPRILPDDLSPDVHRTAYTTITYAPDESYKTKYFKKDDDSDIVWMDNDSDRLPDYGDMVAWSLFVDIDIKNDYKKRPLSKEHKELITERLNLWVKAFSKMTGDTKHVKLLDSGGGIYIFTPPSILSPIADEFDKEDRELLFSEIGQRMRTVTGQLNSLIVDSDDFDDEILSADKVQNKNRQFKTIGSVHKTIDAVVHPINPDDITILHKRMSDITDEDINIAEEWVKDFTNESHSECIGNVIEYLFQGNFTKRDNVELEYVEGVDWKDILETWLEEKKQKIELWEDSLEMQSDISDEELNTDITSDISVAREALRRVNNDKLKSYIVNFVGENKVYEKNGNEMDFYPFWRGKSSKSGRSAFYDFYEGKARFTDKADGTSRDIVYWVALEMTYNSKDYPDCDMIDSPGESLSKKDYRLAIDELRNRGEEIPLFINEPDNGYSLSDEKLVNIGRSLDIINESEVIDLEDGEKLNSSGYKKVINKLEEHDIKHNRGKNNGIKPHNIKPAYDKYDKSQITESEINDQFYKSTEYAWVIPEFASEEHYIEVLNSVPETFTFFTYEDEKYDNNKLLLGYVIDETDNKIIVSDFEPFPLVNLDRINQPSDMTDNNKREFEKTKLTLFIKPEYKK